MCGVHGMPAATLLSCRRCHVDDPEHQMVRCNERCARLHARCHHPCTKRCHEECGKCGVVIKQIKLACGHLMHDVECWR